MIQIEERPIETIFSLDINNKNIDNKVIKRNESSNQISSMLIKSNSYSCPSKSQQLISTKFCSQTITPNNSCSRIVLNCNTNFSSLRIEDPKRGKNSSKLITYLLPLFSNH